MPGFRKDSVDIAAEVTNTPIGSLGHLPFENQSFDVVYAMSALEYVEDLAQSLEEIARVADKTNPRAHIVIMQGAAENEALKLIDSICAPLSTKGEACHQGYLLHTAASLLPRIGFPNIRIQHVTANLQFSEITLSEQCAQAAESLASLRHLECSNFSSMKENLIPQLKLLFQDHPGSIRNEMIVLIASL